ncbi:SusC/RagA family TonB-linked outer membrane protein [Spirosoma validum]|uniref:TonB-dependent receptor n=1 Tax=Spirosoma validum TaxID=2771355 RepID=A0A927GFE8_9BACT|nr:TonB-dependent receptor [Spirosoma validum]MBD2755842.1 TonB-dependent receptor [Spirosoma validum]
MKKTVKLFVLLLLLGQSYVFAQNARVTGKITGPDNQGLPGVNVQVSGTTTGTSSDAAGNFAINAASNASLVFSNIGYVGQTIPINGRSIINVQLAEDLKTLNEVVVVGYGTQRKSDVTGALSAISTKEFAQQPITRLDQVLQGRVAGVQVNQTNGAPGGDAKIRIRGANSILGSNNPLYIVDGYVGADFNFVNPSDIETLQVLKDASATSIYGSRGANGVIIITTKKGSRGFKVNYEGQFSTSEVIKRYDILPAGEFAEIVNARATATGSGLPFTAAQIDDYKRNGGTDWQNLVFRNGTGQQHQITVSGGSDKTTFLVSGNYLNQNGIVNNSDFKRYILRTNINTQINDKLSFRVNLWGTRTENHNTLDGGPIVQALAWAPTTPAYGSDGLPTFNDPIGSVFRNPLDILYDQSIDTRRSSLNLNAGVNYKLPIKGLSIDLQYAVNYLNAQNLNLSGPRISNGIPSASRYSAEQVTLQNTNNLTYDVKLGDHSINAVAVLETQQFTDRNFTATASGLRFPQLGYDNIGNNTAANVASGYGKSTLFSLLGRINYGYKDRYLVTAAVRRDGSSKFGPDNKYSVFPSLALGWRLSEEAFIKNLNVFSNLKLRGSWGLTGSQAIGSYATLTTYNNIQSAFNNSAATAGVILGNPGNINLKWETTRQTDVGLEMEFFNGRLHTEVDYFHKTTFDLLLNAAIPSYAGGGIQVRNIGEVENKGFEFSIGGTAIDKGGFRWESNFNFATLANKVLSLGDLPRLGVDTRVGGGMSPTNEFMLVPGQPLGAYWGLRYLGTWKPNEADQAALQGRVPGDPHYEDINNSNSINTDDFQIIGRAFPKLTGGWNNTFTYKGLTLNLFFNGVFGVDKLNYTRAAAMSGSGDARQFLLTEIRDYYRPGNETSDVPAFTKTYQPFTQSSRFLENGSFVRLKNVSLAYSLPNNVFKNKANVRVFFSATNLLTFTKYSGPDPESSRSSSGTDTAIGIDYGSYPNAKQYTLGINLGF